MTMVPFSRNGAIPIFSHFLVLTYEKNRIEFAELPDNDLETKLFYASLHVFLATAAAPRKLFQSDVKLVLFAFIYFFFFSNFGFTSFYKLASKPCMSKSFGC